jgi:cation diffusion facilitator family transporter
VPTPARDSHGLAALADAPSDTRASDEKERSVLIGILTCSAALPVGIVGVVLGNSVALLADLLRATAELVAMVLSWLTLRAVRRTRHDVFNYGLGKLESAASVMVGAALMVAFVVVLGGSLARFLAPAPIGNAWLGLAVTVAGMGGSVWLWRRNYAIARRSPSPVMDAQWRLYRSKAVANLIVSVSVGVALGFKGQAWAAYVDPAGSLAIAGFLLYSAWTVASSSVHDLLDRALEESRQLLIVRVLAKHFDVYEHVREIRSRRSGARIYIEIFLGFDADRTLGEVQRAIDAMRTDLEALIAGSSVVIVPAAARLP